MAAQSPYLEALQEDPHLGVVMAFSLPLISLAFGFTPAEEDMEEGGERRGKTGGGAEGQRSLLTEPGSDPFLCYGSPTHIPATLCVACCTAARLLAPRLEELRPWELSGARLARVHA